MSRLDDVRRWAKDRFSQDEYITGTPREKMREVEQVLPQLTHKERLRNMEQLNAYATYYHEVHHKEAVPFNVRQELKQMRERAHRLSAVDAAREVLHKYGGPPSSETIKESLVRSQKERERIRESVKPETQQESIRAQGYRMRAG